MFLFMDFFNWMLNRSGFLQATLVHLQKQEVLFHSTHFKTKLRSILITPSVQHQHPFVGAGKDFIRRCFTGEIACGTILLKPHVQSIVSHLVIHRYCITNNVLMMNNSINSIYNMALWRHLILLTKKVTNVVKQCQLKGEIKYNNNLLNNFFHS